jgi:hypothetical protein
MVRRVKGRKGSGVCVFGEGGWGALICSQEYYTYFLQGKTEEFRGKRWGRKTLFHKKIHFSVKISQVS